MHTRSFQGRTVPPSSKSSYLLNKNVSNVAYDFDLVPLAVRTFVTPKCVQFPVQDRNVQCRTWHRHRTDERPLVRFWIVRFNSPQLAVVIVPSNGVNLTVQRSYTCVVRL